MVVDSSSSVKIPSDFAGITRAHYDGAAIGTYDISAISSACNVIERSIRQRKIPSYLSRLQGNWKSRFASGPFSDHPTMIDDVEIKLTVDGISLTGSSGSIAYTGEGRIYYENQIIGEWTHPPHLSMARGVFMLYVNTIADTMYGYCTSQDAHGTTIFGKWVFAKNNDSGERVSARLLRAQKFLEDSTIGPPLAGNQ